jgi:hypothetical protein
MPFGLCSAACTRSSLITCRSCSRSSKRPKKFLLFQKKVQYLGHIVTPEGVIIGPKKLKYIWEGPLLKDKYELRSSLGLCTYYWRFIDVFMDTAKPLTQLMKEKWTLQWSPEAEAAL